MRCWQRLAACSTWALAAAAAANPLSVFYGFSDPLQTPTGEAPVSWPASLANANLDGHPFAVFAPIPGAPGVTMLENYTGNVTFFDDNYQAAKNSSLISGNAWWGNPTEQLGHRVHFGLGLSGFSDINGRAVSDTIEFDIAIAKAGQAAPLYLELDIYGGFDTSGPHAMVAIDLEPFRAGPTFGGFSGGEGHVVIRLADLLSDNAESFTNVDNINIYADTISALGGTGEMVIDNLSINGAAPNDPIPRNAARSTINVPQGTRYSTLPLVLNTGTSSAQVADGQSNSDQSISIQTVNNLPAQTSNGAKVEGQAFDIHFSESEGAPNGQISPALVVVSTLMTQEQMAGLIGQEKLTQLMTALDNNQPAPDVGLNLMTLTTDGNGEAQWVTAEALTLPGPGFSNIDDLLNYYANEDLGNHVGEQTVLVEKYVEDLTTLLQPMVITILEHNSEFAIGVVPEPAIAAGVLVGTACLLRRRARPVRTS